MEDYEVCSAASILASVKEQEARFERLTRALEEERRNVSLQLERSNITADRLGGTGPNANLPPNSQPLAWQQVVMQVNHASTPRLPVPLTPCLLRLSNPPPFELLWPLSFHRSTPSYVFGSLHSRRRVVTPSLSPGRLAADPSPYVIPDLLCCLDGDVIITM